MAPPWRAAHARDAGETSHHRRCHGNHGFRPQLQQGYVAKVGVRVTYPYVSVVGGLVVVYGRSAGEL